MSVLAATVQRKLVRSLCFDAVVGGVKMIVSRQLRAAMLLVATISGVAIAGCYRVSNSERNGPKLTTPADKLDADSAANDQGGKSDQDAAKSLGPSLTTESQRILVAFQEAALAKDWERAAAHLREMSHFEHRNVPFIRWRAWFLGYQVAAEQEASSAIYRWKRMGTLALLDGLTDDADQPELLCEVAWYLGQGIGRSAHSDLRKYFADDDSFHDLLDKYVQTDVAAGPEGRPDCWLVSKLFYSRAIEAAERTHRDFGERSPVIVLVGIPMAQANHAVALQEDGYWGRSAVAWKEAERLFREFEEREIPEVDGTKIRLSDVRNSQPVHPYRRIVNLDCWLVRCHIEQDPLVLQARQLIRRADDECTAGNLDSNRLEVPGAKQLYRQGFARWADVFGAHPEIKNNDCLMVGITEAADSCRKRFGESVIPSVVLEFCGLQHPTVH